MPETSHPGAEMIDACNAGQQSLGIPTHQDAELIAVCDAFITVEARTNERIHAEEDLAYDDAWYNAIRRTQDAPFEQLTSLRPRTLDGVRALLNAMLAEDLELSPDDFDAVARNRDESRDRRILFAILRNLWELSAGPAEDTCKVLG